MVCGMGIMNGGNESVIECCVDEWKKGEFWSGWFCAFVFLSD